MLTIRLLGEMAVLRDDAPVGFPPSRKTRALLAYLVANPRPQRRERLCSLLWELPDDPRGALRWSLSKLRALVDEPEGMSRILADRETVAFVGEGVRCDLHALRDVAGRFGAVPTEQLQRVADDIAGDFLEGLDLPAQPDFQAWCLAEREDVRRQHAALLNTLIARLYGVPEEALPHARRRVALEPYDEQARVALVELLGRLGRREEAEQQSESGLRLLHEARIPAGALVRATRALRIGPRHPPETPEAASVGSAAAALPPASGAMPGRRLIVVDDEPELGHMVAEYLARYGFSVRTATSGRELDGLLESEPADLLILDVNMPGEDGFAIARRLRGSPRILFLTAASDVIDRIVGLELGAEDYMTKPFDLRELRARIRIVLRRSEVAGDAEGGGASDNPSALSRREPTAGGHEIDTHGVKSPAPHSRSSAAEGGRDTSPADRVVEQQATAPLPAQEIRFCTAADGVRIAYATVGRGPPLLRPATWITHLEYDWESPVWRHWLRELSRDHCLIRYDARANGLSDRDVDDLSFEAMVADLEAVAETSGLRRFPLLGISQGCPVAIAYAVRHPERVSRLILYGGYASGWAVRGTPEEAAHRRALTTLILRGWGQDNPAFRQVFTLLFIPEATPDQMRWFNDLQRRTISPENAFRLQHVFGEIQVCDLLPHVRTPTLVLHARNDEVVPFEQGRLLASFIPGAQFVPLESRNHLLLEGEPAWAKFLKELRSFLNPDLAPHGASSSLPERRP